MNRTLYLMGLILCMAGCGSLPASLSSGIEGQVWIGPMCPVMQMGSPCPDLPFQARLTILDPHGHNVASLQSGVDGAFHMALAPGMYLLRPESPGSMPHAPEQPFSVQANQFTRLTVTYDSGIR